MKQETTVVGVIADTHIPDKTLRLLPEVFDTFINAGVSIIIHAGDISIPKVLRQLETIAPVKAVRGNRDWLIPGLPKTRYLSLQGTTIGITHGHGNMQDYIKDKFLHLTGGYSFDHYRQVVQKACPKAKVIVFGHSHVPENRWVNGILFFNPGTPRLRGNKHSPSVGLLTLSAGGKVQGEIINISP